MDICILTPQSSEVLDAEGSSRHVPVGFLDGAAPKGIGSCEKVVTLLIYTVIHFSIILLYSFIQDHESEIIGSQLKFSFINISIDWGGFILSDFSRLSIRN